MIRAVVAWFRPVRALSAPEPNVVYVGGVPYVRLSEYTALAKLYVSMATRLSRLLGDRS